MRAMARAPCSTSVGLVGLMFSTMRAIASICCATTPIMRWAIAARCCGDTGGGGGRISARGSAGMPIIVATASPLNARVKWKAPTLARRPRHLPSATRL
jgi:hypothetical protein